MITLTHIRSSALFAFILILNAGSAAAQQTQGAFAWPRGNQIAISLSFDDARMSQVDTGTALLDQYGVKATFYVVPSSVERRLDGWRRAVENGHEIGNHSLLHPCSGNFAWSRDHALENYSLDRMKKELSAANDSIRRLLGVGPTSFAYPCGSSFVGRGTAVQSYVPVVAGLFATGRGWLNEGPNDPVFCDFAQLTGIETDGKDFDQILPIIQAAREHGSWIVFAGHEMGEGGAQTTRLSMLKQLMEYAKNPDNGIWIAPVNAVAAYVRQHRVELNN
jgi:peptidoglycan-N-acetylglucosamine deacetylase